jgi:hypothetical protein
LGPVAALQRTSLVLSLIHNHLLRLLLLRREILPEEPHQRRQRHQRLRVRKQQLRRSFRLAAARCGLQPTRYLA